MKRRISKEREKALKTLLDDESPVVQEALLKAFRELGRDGCELLRHFSRTGNRITAEYAKRFLEQLEGPDAGAEFIRFIRSLHYELESGFILLNRLYAPQVEPIEILQQLDSIARRVGEISVNRHSALEQCKVLNRVLFHELGFRGNRDDFDDPLNSFLSAVLRRRKGIPISLSILYILVGRRCKLELEPICLPGRFMVGCFSQREPFFVDPFERGAFRPVDEIMDFLAQNGVDPDPVYLAPAPVGEVLCRCCRNLGRQYSLRNNPARARLFWGFVQEFEEVYRRHAQS